MLAIQSNTISTLRSEILHLEGFKPSNSLGIDHGLGHINDAFPNNTFPLGAVHEFLSSKTEATAATTGFIAGLLSPVMGTEGIVLWISAHRQLFPPALIKFGIDPDRFIFVDLPREKDVMWAMDEAMKCGALAAVVGEVNDISFNDSRRLQLAVEQSKVTGFVIRKSQKVNTTACVSRWRITSLPGDVVDDIPGIGFPQWKVELLRMRNGRAGSWNVRWMNNSFVTVEKPAAIMEIQHQKKAG